MFLYEFKNFVRDLTDMINAGYATEFDQAGEFCQEKGGSKIRRWAVGNFGAEDWLTRFPALHETGLWEVVQLQNAIEHPKGRSGMLHVLITRWGGDQIAINVPITFSKNCRM